MIDNTPVWVEVNVQGETTGEQYFGKFYIKKYLTQEERSDVARESDRRNYGIAEDAGQKAMNNMLSQLQAHVVQADAAWWVKDKEGRVVGLMDDNPITDLMKKLREQQNSWRPKTPAAPAADAAAKPA